MIVGLDYWNTITRDVKLFTSLASALISEGHTVYIVSAVGSVRVKTTKQEIEKLDIPNHGIFLCEFKHHSEAPQLKLRVCGEMGIQMFFDDRKDICELLNENGIVACQVHKGKSFTPSILKPGVPV